MRRELSRDELIKLVEQILDPTNDDEDITKWLNIFEDSVPHPEASDLIFWPDDHGLGDSPTPEEIVEKALNYKPMRL